MGVLHPEVEKIAKVPVNVIEEEEDSAEDDYEMRRREKGKNALPKMVDDHVKELPKTQVPIYIVEGLIMERKQNQADMAKMIADAIQQD
ncbi:hypothetical protein Tco_1518107 [Tanacetum coccineum]